jgi:predicted membrane metal-binding protein
LSVAVVAAVLRRAERAALGLVLIGGALVALTSAPPERRTAKPVRATATDGRASTGHGAEPEADDGILGRAHERASQSIDRLFGSDAPMARALLIADQHRIPPEMRDRYARAGMVHMLSISGLHVAIVAGAVVLLLQAARIPRSHASLLGIGITAF